MGTRTRKEETAGGRNRAADVGQIRLGIGRGAGSYLRGIVAILDIHRFGFSAVPAVHIVGGPLTVSGPVPVTVSGEDPRQCAPHSPPQNHCPRQRREPPMS